MNDFLSVITEKLKRCVLIWAKTQPSVAPESTLQKEFIDV